MSEENIDNEGGQEQPVERFVEKNGDRPVEIVESALAEAFEKE